MLHFYSVMLKKYQIATKNKRYPAIGSTFCAFMSVSIIRRLNLFPLKVHPSSPTVRYEHVFCESHHYRAQ